MTTIAPELTTLFSQLSQVDENFVLLTPNNRLSRFIQSQYAEFQKAHIDSQQRPLRAWPSFPCYSLRIWYGLLWEQLLFSGHEIAQAMVLDASQESALWLDIIRDNSEDLALFNPSATAGVARRAWNTVLQWGCEQALQVEGSEVFNDWAAKYRRALADRGLMDSPSMVNALLTAIELGQIALPETLVLYAFDDLPPQLRRLTDIADNKQCRVFNVDAKIPRARASRVGLTDSQEELGRAAHWAAALIEREAHVKVGIVIPQLAQMRARVERVFNQVFEPQYVLPNSARHASAFNISAGVALSSTAPVAAALLALKLNRRDLDIEDVDHLLHSPFVGVAEEIPARALLCDKLRQKGAQVGVAQLRRWAGEFGRRRSDEAVAEQPPTEMLMSPALTDDFYRRLHRFHEIALRTPDRQSPSAWAQTFCAQLAAMGWPGNRVPDTLEFQQVEVWQQTLQHLPSYDYIFPETNLTQAMELLERLAFDTQFQAQTTDSAVQILGVLEAAGMTFDYLWVMNLDKESWPLPISPNALLPMGLQKREEMPLASAKKELWLAKKLTQRFAQSATEVVFSYRLLDGDKSLGPSPIIEYLPSVDAAALPSADIENNWQLVSRSGGLEAFVDACGPPVEQPKSVRGGTQILKDQAACPFRAFAKHRLHASEPDKVVAGFSGIERGSLIHAALDIIWKKLRHQQALLELDEKQLNHLINASVLESFRELEANKSFGARLKALECSRMERLLRVWLECDKQRAPFSVVLSETKNTISLAQLPIHIRYDRVDKLDDGSVFVVDYKTAKVDVKTWAGHRPDEPQVPLYALANQHVVSGVAFGQINTDEVAYKGVAENTDAAPGLRAPDQLGKYDMPPTWQEILKHWREVLEQLAREFLAGHAAVDPKYARLTCQYCGLHSLCRVREQASSADDSDITENAQGLTGGDL